MPAPSDSCVSGVDFRDLARIDLLTAPNAAAQKPGIEIRAGLLAAALTLAPLMTLQPDYIRDGAHAVAHRNTR
jgi:hypothetical protein